ncbi:MAG: hypothetical protein ACNS62_16460 [Candidatus Cyclobacteriaceae bacterium M3_2C_046]
MENIRKQKYWRIVRTIALIVALLTFTPLVIPSNVYKPMLWGIPYTLWTGYLVAIVLVVLTYIGTRVHPGIQEEEEGKL